MGHMRPSINIEKSKVERHGKAQKVQFEHEGHGARNMAKCMPNSARKMNKN